MVVQTIYKPLLFAGGGRKTEEDQISQLPLGGSGSGRGVSGSGRLHLQSDVSVGPQLGKGKTEKYN